MNDFLARNSNIQPSRTAERASRAVAEAQASGQSSARQDGKAASPLGRTTDADVDQQLSSAAEVAEAQAKIAVLLSELDSLQDAAVLDTGALEAKIAALLPRPTIIVPLPPASRDVVEHAVEVAESVRAIAALALAAQANIETATAEGVLA